MEAYFDESGIHDGAKVCVVGGYYGSQAAWKRFGTQWSKIITDYPELETTGFHAKEFFDRADGRRVGQYKDWTDDKARHFLDRLIQAIMRNRIFPIGYAVVVDDFLALPLQDRQWFTGARFTVDGEATTSGCPNKSYYLPFSFCVLDSTRQSGATVAEKIHLFAGLDRTFHEYATVLYKFMLMDSRLPRSIKELLGGITYPLAKDTPGIQAADLLVYRFYRFVLDKLKAKQNLPVPPLVEQLTRNRKAQQKFDLFDSVRLRRLQEIGRQAYERLIQEGKLPEYIASLQGS